MMANEVCFVDTNLFLRYLTDDIPEQAEAFEQILHRAAGGELTLVTNAMVMAEIVWTLESYYRLPPEQVQEQVLAILNTPGIETMDGDLVLQAVMWHDEKTVDFIDAYNAAWMFNQGIDTIFTFDRKHFVRFEKLKAIVPT